jgi:MYXO-CTERM domain-containing protein
VAEGVEGVSLVPGYDGAAVGSTGLLVGLAFHGAPVTGGPGADPVTYAAVAPIGAWIQGLVGVPSNPDAGVTGDAGTSGDAGEADAGPGPDEGDEKGCGCRSSPSGGPLYLLLLVTGYLLRRRRRFD